VKIVEVRPLVLGTRWRNLTFVVVGTDEGLEGVGRGRGSPAVSALEPQSWNSRSRAHLTRL
jgi:hypothetical protein